MWWSKATARKRRAVPERMAPAAPPAGGVTREDYRTARLALLRSVVDLEHDEGLEIGAFDLPTVAPAIGRCAIADARSREDLARTFSVPIESVAPVTWVIDGARTLAEQIPQRFDYVIGCHVLEHIPNPIAFLNDAGALLRSGGVLVLAIPDKRRTADAARPSTTIDHLLARHHHGAQTPPLAQIMEFARAWNDDLRRLATEQPREFYAWAVTHFEGGRADVHCNVWEDEELFAQLDYLTRGGFVPDLEVLTRQPNGPQFNEFYVVLRRTAATVPA